MRSAKPFLVIWFPKSGAQHVSVVTEQNQRRYREICLYLHVEKTFGATGAGIRYVVDPVAFMMQMD
jgi:hypothetical protein